MTKLLNVPNKDYERARVEGYPYDFWSVLLKVVPPVLLSQRCSGSLRVPVSRCVFAGVGVAPERHLWVLLCLCLCMRVRWVQERVQSWYTRWTELRRILCLSRGQKFVRDESEDEAPATALASCASASAGTGAATATATAPASAADPASGIDGDGMATATAAATTVGLDGSGLGSGSGVPSLDIAIAGDSTAKGTTAATDGVSPNGTPASADPARSAAGQNGSSAEATRATAGASGNGTAPMSADDDDGNDVVEATEADTAEEAVWSSLLDELSRKNPMRVRPPTRLWLSSWRVKP